MTRRRLWLIMAAAIGITASILFVSLRDPIVDGRSNEATADADWETIRSWLESPSAQGKPKLRFRILQPGTILPSDALTRPRLPENTTITITRQGDKPAQIVVQQGDRRWEVNEQELDKLPPPVRRNVQRMLGTGFAWPGEEERTLDLVPDAASATATTRRRPPPDWLSGQLEEMNRRMEQLRRKIEDLPAN